VTYPLQPAGHQTRPIPQVGVPIVMKKNVWRAVIEVAFILFLFYSNLLMGEFERSGMGSKNGLAWAIGDILTFANFEIATVAAIIGYILFEFLRKKF
jgi:dolichol kinase